MSFALLFVLLKKSQNVFSISFNLDFLLSFAFCVETSAQSLVRLLFDLVEHFLRGRRFKIEPFLCFFWLGHQIARYFLLVLIAEEFADFVDLHWIIILLQLRDRQFVIGSGGNPFNHELLLAGVRPDKLVGRLAHNGLFDLGFHYFFHLGQDHTVVALSREVCGNIRAAHVAFALTMGGTVSTIIGPAQGRKVRLSIDGREVFALPAVVIISCVFAACQGDHTQGGGLQVVSLRGLGSLVLSSLRHTVVNAASL